MNPRTTSSLNLHLALWSLLAALGVALLAVLWSAFGGGEQLALWTAIAALIIAAGLSLALLRAAPAAQRLRQTQEALNRALEAMPSGLLLLDKDGRIVISNEQIRAIYDVPSELMQPGDKVRNAYRYLAEKGSLGPGDPEEAVEQRFRELYGGQPMQYQRALADGGVLAIEQTPVEGGGVVVLATDISDLVESQRGAALLRDALESFPDVVILFDRNERVVFSNDRYHEVYPGAPPKSEILGYTMEGLLRHHLEHSDVPSSVRAEPEVWVRDYLETMRRTDGAEDEAPAPDGRTLLNKQRRTDEGGVIILQIDITDQKRAQQLIEESRELIDRLFESIPSAVGVVNAASGKILRANDATAEILGLEPAAVVGTLAEDVYADPKDRARLVEAVVAGEGRGSIEVEIRHAASGGTRLCILTAVLVNYDGEPANVFGLVDITESRSAEQALRESEEQLAAIVEGAPVALSVTNAAGERVLFNQALADLTGISREALTGGGRIDDWVDDENLAHMNQQFREHGAVRNHEFPVTRPDGSVAWVMANVELVRRFGESLRVMWALDLSERRGWEQRLSEQRELLDAVIANMDQGVVHWDRENKIRLFNPQICRLWGLPDDGIQIGQSFQELLDMVAGKGAAGDAVDASYAQSQSATDAETAQFSAMAPSEVSTPGGRILEIRNNVTPDGGFVATHVDVTERKQAEQDIIEARNAAQAASEAKAAFLAAMSHEIRTPMNGVVGMVDLLNQTRLDSEQRHMVGVVRDSAHSLLTIINDILDFSKIEAGKLELESIPCSLEEIVESTLSAIAPNAVKKGLGLIAQVSPEIPGQLRGDPVRIRQVLFNLCGNAIKFSEDHQVVVAVNQLSRTDTTCRVRIDVIDRGIGISEEAQRDLFSEFSQADTSTTREFGGTGLGLAISQRLAQMMGGEITVTSVLGEGSTFSLQLDLPIELDEPDADADALAGVRALIISSNDFADITHRAYLEAAGATVMLAAPTELPDLARFEVMLAGADFHTADALTNLQAQAPSELRWVVSRDARTPVDAFSYLSEATFVDSNPVCRRSLVHAVAVAAGRRSPEVDYGEVDLEKTPAPTEGDVPEGLILLVEDNPTNQDVITRQLRLLGYTNEIASDGVEGLEKWQSGRYALVLTDCHMPAMDGFELTAAIRDAQRETDEHIPIIAITANALQGESERCIAAGMDDYLSKPVDMKALDSCMRRWLTRGSERIRHTEQPDSEPAMEVPEAPSAMDGETEPAIDESAIKSVFGDDQETFVEILSEFVPTTEGILVELGAARAAGEGQSVRAAAHKLKSSARSVGATRLADLCAELEAAGAADDWDSIAALYPEAENSFAAVRAYVAEL